MRPDLSHPNYAPLSLFSSLILTLKYAPKMMRPDLSHPKYAHQDTLRTINRASLFVALKVVGTFARIIEMLYLLLRTVFDLTRIITGTQIASNRAPST